MNGPSKWVLVVVEDTTLAELLAESLFEAGHVAQIADSREVLEGDIDCGTFSAAIVDLDSRTRAGTAVVDRIRHDAPDSTVIALLPCGGHAADYASVRYHLAIEKPARLKSVLAAVTASRIDPR